MSPRKKRLAFTATLVLFNLLAAAGLYLGSVLLRAAAHHGTHSRWIGNPYGPDVRYGYFPRPFARAYHSLQDGERVPVRFDEEGFRIPDHDDQQSGSRGRRILFLGDSFTHGYGVRAEETFAYLAARGLDATALNAGVSGWGLSQMLLRARDVVPRLKPDIVVAQYTGWLPYRSMGFYGPTEWAKSPVPYFYENAGTLEIHGPAFESIAFALPVAEYAQKELVPFLWHVGIPLVAHDDAAVLRTFLGSRLGRLPRPAASERRVVEYAYREMQRVCSASGARLVVLMVPAGFDGDAQERLAGFSFPVVPTLPALRERLPQATPEAWAQDYYFWRGNPPRIVDKHPNARMHAAIADVLIQALRERPGP